MFVGGDWLGVPCLSLENYFRAFAGWDQITETLSRHYLLALIYPAGLTQTIQLMLVGVVIMSNVIIYTVIIRGAQKGAPGQSEFVTVML